MCHLQVSGNLHPNNINNAQTLQISRYCSNLVGCVLNIMMMLMDVFSLRIIIINELLVEFSADENMYRSACAALSAHISAHWHFVQVSLLN